MNRKASYERKARLSELLKEILAETLSRLDDPDLELLSITEVEVDNNLNRAKVFVTSLEINHQEKTNVLKALENNLSAFLNDIATKARIRQLPAISFHIDEGFKASSKIDEILKEMDSSQNE